MKSTLRILALLLMGLLPFSALHASSHEGEAHEHSELEDSMSQINRSWRLVKRQVRSPEENKATVALIEKMIAESKVAIEMVPEFISDAEDKEAFLNGYKAEMKVLTTDLGKLAELLKADDNDAARSLIRAIDSHRRDSHQKYRRPDEDE